MSSAKQLAEQQRSHLPSAKAVDFASMDFKGKLEPNQTANQKVQQDLLNFMSITGVKTAGAQVFIEHVEGSQAGSTFDLAAPANYLKLFRIRVTVPYSSVSTVPISFMSNRTITASTVFRRGRIVVSSN